MKIQLGLAGAVTLGAVLWAVLTPRAAQAACVALPTDKGQATFTVTIPSTASYRVWSRVYVPTASANGLYMQIDQANCNVVVGHGGTMPAGQLTWVDWIGGNQATKFDVNLNSGTHTVIVAGLDDKVGLDEVMFLSDKSCIPIGNGSNCVSGGVAVTPVPQPSATPVVVGGANTPTSVSGVIDLAANNPDAVTTTFVVDGKVLAGTQLDTSKLSDGKHVIDVITKTADGKITTVKQTIEVQNGWQYKLVAGMQRQWPWFLAGMGTLLIVVAGGLLAWRSRLKWFHPRVKATPAGVAPQAPKVTAGDVVKPAETPKPPVPSSDEK